MKAVFEKTPHAQWESFHCEVVRGSSYNAMWHFHPEIQLTLVLESRGHRMVGDNISPLHPGDLVLVGSNLPHVWHQVQSPKSKARSPKSQVHAIVVRFLDTFLGAEFIGKPELEPVRQLLRRAARGLQVIGRTRDVAAARMESLAGNTGLQRIVDLLAILDLLAGSQELRPLASAGFVPTIAHADQDRMQRVCSYINAHLVETIDRDRVAAEAHLSAGAFSRFFKQRTGKTLPEYVNALRIGRACELLAEDRWKITDIAMECGFRNLANFNRHFRSLIKLSPREYRTRFRETAS
ncbi:MAG: AraC family transcriptional regulator [Chthoniobacteraceae bacterium]